MRKHMHVHKLSSTDPMPGLIPPILTVTDFFYHPSCIPHATLCHWALPSVRRPRQRWFSCLLPSHYQVLHCAACQLLHSLSQPLCAASCMRSRSLAPLAPAGPRCAPRWAPGLQHEALLGLRPAHCPSRSVCLPVGVPVLGLLVLVSAGCSSCSVGHAHAPCAFQR